MNLLLVKMGLLSWFSNNKVNTQVENIEVNGQNINLNTSHTQWLEEIKIGVEVLVIVFVLVIVAIILKKLYKINKKRKLNEKRKLQREILGLKPTTNLAIAQK